MPELKPERGPIFNFVEAARERAQQLNPNGLYLYSHQIDALVRTANVDFLGSGCEMVVVNGIGEKVWAFSYRDLPPREAKIVFYLQRVFSTLFPHNFPRFHAAYGGDPFFTSRQLVTQTEARAVLYPFSAVTRQFHELGVPPGIVDWASHNYAVGVDGGEYYLDRLSTQPYVLRSINARNFINYMESGDYSGQETGIVAKSLERVASLRTRGNLA